MILIRLWYKQEAIIEVHEGKEVKYIGLNSIFGKYLSKERYCIGYISDIEKYTPCGARVTRGYICEECKKKDIFLSCAICTGKKCLSKSEIAKQWCNQKFYVYLAYFGGKKVKVGVSAKKRLKERLLEQGAIAYKIVKEAENGLEARKIESKFKKAFVDRLRVEEKVKLYKNIDLDWFSREFGTDGVFKNYLEVANQIRNQKFLKSLIIPRDFIGAIGQLLVFRKALINFKNLVGRRLFGFYDSIM